MSSIQLRPYQQEACEAVHKEWETRRSTLLVIPTGGGKTIIFSAIIEDVARKMIDRIAANGWRLPYGVTAGIYTPDALAKE